jgi:hypothetical protein
VKYRGQQVHTGRSLPERLLAGFGGPTCGLDGRTDIYRNSPVLTSLHDTSNLQGKCGV